MYCLASEFDNSTLGYTKVKAPEPILKKRVHKNGLFLEEIDNLLGFQCRFNGTQITR